MIVGFYFRPGGIDESICGYYPMFPASCPYVTAVGGTSGGLTLDLAEQVACSSDNGQNITTGGGFSAYYLQPSFQRNAVNSYFSQVTPPYSDNFQYSTQYRGYPDVSLIAADYGNESFSCSLFS